MINNACQNEIITKLGKVKLSKPEQATCSNFQSNNFQFLQSINKFEGSLGVVIKLIHFTPCDRSLKKHEHKDTKKQLLSSSTSKTSVTGSNGNGYSLTNHLDTSESSMYLLISRGSMHRHLSDNILQIAEKQVNCQNCFRYTKYVNTNQLSMSTLINDHY